MSKADAAQQATRPTQADSLPVVKFTESGQEVYGVVRKVAFGLKGGTVDLIEVEDEDQGDVTVFLGSTGLQQGLVEGGNNLGRPIQKGDTVYIRFDGYEDLDGGKTFKHFALHLEAGDPRAQAASKAAPSGAQGPGDVVPSEDDDDLPF